MSKIHRVRLAWFAYAADEINRFVRQAIDDGRIPADGIDLLRRVLSSEEIGRDSPIGEEVARRSHDIERVRQACVLLYHADAQDDLDATDSLYLHPITVLFTSNYLSDEQIDELQHPHRLALFRIARGAYVGEVSA